MSISIPMFTTCFLLLMAVAEFHGAIELCADPLNSPVFLKNPMFGSLKGYTKGLDDVSTSHFIEFVVVWVSGNKFMFGVADLLMALYGSHMQRILFCSAISIVLNPIIQLPLNAAAVAQKFPDEYSKGQEGVDQFSFAFTCVSALAAVAAVCEMLGGRDTLSKKKRS